MLCGFDALGTTVHQQVELIPLVKTHWGRVTQICITELGHQGFRKCLAAWSVLSHCQTQRWILVNWTHRDKFQWNSKPYSQVFSEENAIENVVCYKSAILFSGHWGSIGSSMKCREISFVMDIVLFCLTHWGRDKMAAIFQKTFWNAFPWMKMYEFRLQFHWSLFLRVQLTIFQHWFG